MQLEILVSSVIYCYWFTPSKPECM